MTVAEFQNTSFSVFSRVVYGGKELPVLGLNFEKNMIAIRLNHRLEWIHVSLLEVKP
jgi:hypothetical protein